MMEKVESDRLELLKRLVTLFYESAKAAKPDCLINTSCGHPYFAEIWNAYINNFDKDNKVLHKFIKELKAITHRDLASELGALPDSKAKTALLARLKR